jgi:hypothetical protein
MRQATLENILRLFKAKPCGPVPTVSDWNTIETVIGRPIPQDYKTILEHTGGCSIGHCFVRNPAVQDNIHMALSRAPLIREHIIMNEMAMELLNIELYPEPAGWVQLARMDRVYFMLKPEGDDIAIADFSGHELLEPGMTFAQLMWTLFNDRKLFDELGTSIWHASDQFFGLP